MGFFSLTWIAPKTGGIYGQSLTCLLSAWIPNTELTPLDVESENTKSPVEKGKSTTLLAAYGKAAETNDLAHSMAMLADRQKVIEIGEEINEEKAADKTKIVLIIALVASSRVETTVQDRLLHFQLGLFQRKPHQRYHYELLAAATQRRRVQWGGKRLANSGHFYQLQGGIPGLRDLFCTSSAADSADGNQVSRSKQRTGDHVAQNCR
ncbi:hypothetical protein BDR22DRAFT_886880 [Usnea florida]